VTAETLSRRALNRATLARQLLLRRADLPVLDTVEHLVGLQAQVPLDPYTALWSRLDGFRPGALADLLVERRVVRTVVMRGTIHLVTADDCLLLRPLVQPVLDAELARHRDYAPHLRELDLEPVLEFARTVFAERPRTGPELRAALGERFSGHDGAALAYACRCLLPLVQVPPRGVWGRTAAVATTTAESWLGRPLAERPSLDEVVLRYLAAFGPAAVADIGTWSRVTGLREVVERLRPGLRTFRDERGRELFDSPTRRGRTPPHRHRHAFSRSTTTCCSRTRTGAASSRQRSAHGSAASRAVSRAPCSTTASVGASGGWSATGTAARRHS